MKIGIIKLGALGDVVRTLCILPALKEKYPQSDICWITRENAFELFENNPYVQKVITTPCMIEESFDILYNFDIDEEATKLAREITAELKLGFSSDNGYPSAFNSGAEYYLNTLFDDELKKNNKKTYQEMMFEASDLDWKKQYPEIFLNEKDKKYAEEFVKENKMNTDKLIGIHVGSGSRWPSKAWHNSCLIEFIAKAKERGYEIILFSGPDDAEKHKKIISELESRKLNIFKNNPQNSIKQFASLVNLCNSVVCSDSLAIHISLALKKKTIGLFFCTSPYEIEGYNLLTKIISPLLYDFFPEKSNQYSEELIKSISPEEVLNALESTK